MSEERWGGQDEIGGEDVTFAEITYMCRMGGLNKYLISISNYIFLQLFDSLSDRNKSDGGSFLNRLGQKDVTNTQRRRDGIVSSQGNRVPKTFF